MKRCLACAHAFEGAAWTCPRCAAAPALESGCLVFAPELCAGDGSDATYRFDDLLAAESRHFWFRARTALVMWALQRYFCEAKSLLEMGCGTGYVLDCLVQARPDMVFAGSDVLTDGLRHARARLPRVSFLQMDGRRIPFESEFDVIAAFDVIEHIEEDRAVLAELFRAVRPGGGILLTVPQHAFLWSSVDEFSGHKRRYSRRELLDKVRAAGFDVLRATSFFSILLPLLAVSRWSKPKSVSELDPAAELRVHPAVNWGLDRLLALERAFIRAGASLPMGGSLLLAARRPASSAA